MRRRCTSSSYSATTDDRLDFAGQCCPPQNHRHAIELAIARSRAGFLFAARRRRRSDLWIVTEDRRSCGQKDKQRPIPPVKVYELKGSRRRIRQRTDGCVRLSS